MRKNKKVVYSIHDIITFEIISNNILSPFKNLNSEYENFKVDYDSSVTSDISICLGKFFPEYNATYKVDNNYYIKKDYIYCKRDRYKKIWWEFEFSGFERGNISIKVSNNFIGNSFISGFLIEPIVIYALNTKGASVIHGSAVSRNGKAYIFTGQGGSGKTTLAISLTENGYKFMGDNFVIVHKGQVLSYLSPLNIFHFNLLNIIKENMPFSKKIEFKLKDLLRKSLNIPLATKVNPKSVFPIESLEHKSELTAIFLLLPKKEFKVSEINKEELIKYLLLNQQLDTIPFYKYLLEYSYLYPHSALGKYWKVYKRNLERNIDDNVLIFKCEVPLDAKITAKKMQRLVEQYA